MNFIEKPENRKILIDIRAYIQTAIAEALADKIELEPPALLEIPRSQEHGDLSTNAAMQLAKPLRNPPRKIAEELVAKLELDPALVSKVEIAGPGFINFTYSADFLRMLASYILETGGNFGSSELGGGKRVNLEFVSANPTGPLNIVSARAAALGDSLKRIMNFSGYEAKSEFYVNDAGQQIVKLGNSIVAELANRQGLSGIEFPQDGYRGEYVRRIAGELYIDLRDFGGDNYAFELAQEGYYYSFGKQAVEINLRSQRDSLKKLGVEFDYWCHESKIRENEGPQNVIEFFYRKNYTKIEDNALFFRASLFDEKEEDRVILTSDGRPTYFLPDIAYHEDKYTRADWLIDIWGPDHHGYIPRMKAALQALGHKVNEPEVFTVIIAQQVNLMRGGEKVKMSKRAGEIIEMQELIDEVGADAARFFFLQRKATAHLDFDLDLAVKETEENPVFYVQYAHARICSIERVAAEAGNTGDPVWEKIGHPAEYNLIRKMSEFPLIVEICAKNLEPQRITVYLGELAASFHSFYQQCRVVTDDAELSAARLGLCRAVRQVLKTGLDLLGVTAPEKM